MRNRMNGGRRPFKEAFERPEVEFDQGGYINLEYNPRGNWPVIEAVFDGDQTCLYTEWNGKEITYDFIQGFDTLNVGEELSDDEEDFLIDYMNDSILQEEYDDWCVSEILKELPSFLKEHDLEIYYDNSSDFANVGTYYVVERGAEIPDGLVDDLELDTDYTRLAWILAGTYEKETGSDDSALSIKVITAD